MDKRLSFLTIAFTVTLIIAFVQQPEVFYTSHAQSAAATATSALSDAIHSLVAARTVAPEPTATITPTPTPQGNGFMQVFVEQALKKRNDSRINFLLFGWGETYEPSEENPDPLPAIIGSVSVLSYDLEHKVIDIVSFTHDTRAPEIERFLKEHGWQSAVPAHKMSLAYKAGGIPLLRQIAENATGLSMDYVVVFHDSLLQQSVNTLFGALEVNVAEKFCVQPFYLDGKKYPQECFAQGKQKLNGLQVVQFIKTVPVSNGYYGKSLEHNARKHVVFRALLDKFRTKCDDRLFWIITSGFSFKALADKNLALDLGPDPGGLLTSALKNAESTAGKECRNSAALTIGKTLYVADTQFGDGGVQWIETDAISNSVSAQDIKNGIYQSSDYEVPIGGNPYAPDLPTGYWKSVRDLIRQQLNLP